MANSRTLVRFGWVDAKGMRTTTGLYLSADTAAHLTTFTATVKALLQAVTNCASTFVSGTFGSAPASGVYGTNALYRDVEDKCILTFTTNSDLVPWRLQIPAPISANFMADGMTVSASSTAMAALIAGFIAADGSGSFVCNRYSDAVHKYIGGTRIRRKNRRRINIFTLDPTLTIPAE